jgi:DNA-binding transcriptional ArsR family regulator
MTDTDDGGEAEGFDPAEVFSLLGDETRLQIVTALYDAALETPVGFSALYERIDIGDSAQFNYHLDRLVPHFVAKSADGYELTERGKRIARVVGAEIYTGGPDGGSFELAGECYACGEPALRAIYEDERFAVECRACGEGVPSAPVPPSLVRGRASDAVGAAVDRWARDQVDIAARGSCPTCGGPVDPVVVEDVSYTVSFEAVAAFECGVCSRRTTMTFGALAIRHPAVRTFHRRRGAPLRDRRYWEIGQYVADENVEVLSRDPWRVRVSFFEDGDALHVEFDETLDGVRTETVAEGAPESDP